MNATDTAAWIGAVTGIGGLIWNIFVQFRAGGRLDVSVNSGMMRIPDHQKDARYVVARVRNVGTAKTTITNMALGKYDSWWARKRMNRSWAAVAPSPSTAQPLPYKLDVGEEWTGMITQTEDLNKLIASDKLWCEIYHSFSSRPVLIHIPPKP